MRDLPLSCAVKLSSLQRTLGTFWWKFSRTQCELSHEPAMFQIGLQGEVLINSGGFCDGFCAGLFGGCFDTSCCRFCLEEQANFSLKRSQTAQLLPAYGFTAVL